MDSITLADIIGYSLTLFFGFIGGMATQKYIIKSSKTIKQNKNTVVNGDIVGGNKNDKEH